MIVELSDIPPEGITFRGEDPGDILELADAGDARAVGPVGYKFRADLVSDELIVRGELKVRVEFICSRCAESFTREVMDPGFARARDIRAEPGAEGGRNPPPGRGEETDCVDLTGDIREAILLAFPSHPVCRSDCKGLCSQCGTNLNLSPCDCRPPAENRWGALSGLVLEKGSTDGCTQKEEIEEQGT